MTDSYRCEIVKLRQDCAVVKHPNGSLVYAPKENFVEISVDLGDPSSDLTLLFSLGHYIVVRSLFELQKAVQGCKMIADEWGADWGERKEGTPPHPLQEAHTSGTATPQGTETMMVTGFVHDLMPTYAVVYALHRGFVFCGHPCFASTGVWESVDVGSWVLVEVEQQTEKQGCHWKATHLTLLHPSPPIRMRKDPIFETWVTRVRCLIGIVKGGFGSAWSPEVGRIHICQKHISGFHCQEDWEMEVFLHTEAKQDKNHWLTTGKYASRLSDNPWAFINWCPSLRLVLARVTRVNVPGFGFLKISGGVGGPLERGGSFQSGVFFSSEDVETWSPGQKMKVGSEWEVFVHPQEGPVNDRGRNPYRALAILPKGTVGLPGDWPLPVFPKRSRKDSERVSEVNNNVVEKIPKMEPSLQSGGILGRTANGEKMNEDEVGRGNPKGKDLGAVGDKVKESKSVQTEGSQVLKEDRRVQTEESVERRLMRAVCSDSEVFAAIARKFPQLIHEILIIHHE